MLVLQSETFGRSDALKAKLLTKMLQDKVKNAETRIIPKITEQLLIKQR